MMNEQEDEIMQEEETKKANQLSVLDFLTKTCQSVTFVVDNSQWPVTVLTLTDLRFSLLLEQPNTSMDITLVSEN